MGRNLTFISALAFLIGCSQAPDIPGLSNNQPSGQAVLLHGDLKAKDLRTIFRQVNRNGRLDALKPYLETPSDAELEPLASLINRLFYRELDSPGGLVAALQGAVDGRAFSGWREEARELVGEADYRERAELVLALGADP